MKNEKNPKVSVIIPIYNIEQYLRECLDSVVNQTLRKIEIICVNDGSTDRSLEILEEYAARDKRFLLMNQPNSGPGVARNRGIQSAMGEYVVFMDADDMYPEKTTLEKLYKAASTNDANICGGSFSSFREDGVIQTRYSGLCSGYTFYKEGEMPYTDYQFDYGFHRFLYRRTFLLDNGIFYPDSFQFEDPPFFVKAMITAEKFYAICDTTYLYRSHYRNQHRNIAASEKRTIDLIKGLTDNIRMALENDLQGLYELTITRCCHDYWSVLLAAEQFDNEDVHIALKALNQSVDIKRLYKDFSEMYKLHLVRDHQLYHASQEELYRTKYDLDCVHASASFRIGRTITWLPRKLRGGVRCYRENGFRYTINRTMEHLHLRKE